MTMTTTATLATIYCSAAAIYNMYTHWNGNPTTSKKTEIIPIPCPLYLRQRLSLSAGYDVFPVDTTTRITTTHSGY